MDNQALKSYLEPGSIIVGVGLGCVLVAAVALYSTFLLQVQSEDGRASQSDNLESVEDNVLEDLKSFLGTNPSGESSEFVRKTQLYEFLERTSENRLAVLLRQSENIDDQSWRHTTQSLTLRRLTATNPHKALNLASSYPREQRKRLVENVFSEWSLMDLSAAATAGIKRQGVDRDIALRAILQTRTDLSESRRVAIGRQFDREELTQRLVRDESAPTLSENPEETWTSTIESTRDLLPVFDSLVRIAKAWVELDGVGALKPILESLKNRFGSKVIAEEIISVVAQSNPSGAFEQVALNPDFKESLTRLTGTWATIDGVAALHSVATVEDYATRQDLLSVVMGRWADSDPKGLLENRNQFPPEMLLRVLNLATGKIARRDSEEVIRLIESLRSEGINTWTVEDSFVKAHSVIDPSSTLDWVLAEASVDNPYRADMLRRAIVEMARRDPARAMEAALNQPIDGGGPIEESVVEIVVRADVDAAIEFLGQVRDEAKSGSFLHVGRALVEQGEPLEALDLGEKLHEDHQDLYYSQVFQIWAHSYPEQLLNDLEDLPSDHIRSIAALSLLRKNADGTVLNSDQVEYVESQLSQEHLDDLSY